MGPLWRRGGPDRHLRGDRGRIVEGADADEDEMRARRRAAEERRAAARAEGALHEVAAVGAAFEPGDIAVETEARGLEAGIGHARARAEILAVAAPAEAGRQRLALGLEVNAAAETAAGCGGHRVGPHHLASVISPHCPAPKAAEQASCERYCGSHDPL